MKDIVFLGGLLAVLMVAMAMVRSDKAEEIPTQVEQTDEEWEVVHCERLERYGDTIVAIQTLVKRNGDKR